MAPRALNAGALAQEVRAPMQDETLLAGFDEEQVDEGFVYFIQVGDRGPIKIGWTVDVQARLALLQCGCPWPLEARRSIPTDEPLKLEAELHRQFAHLRMRGEWFVPDDDLEAFVNSKRGAPKIRPHTSLHKKRQRPKGTLVGLDAYRQQVKQPSTRQIRVDPSVRTVCVKPEGPNG